MNAQLEKRLIEILAEQVGGMTPGALIRELRIDFPELGRSSFQRLLKQMAREGRLVYTLRLGSTRIALGYPDPARISARIYLTAHPCSGPSASGVCVRLNAGTAFGSGDHPTTCLMLRALDQALDLVERAKELAGISVLDVGTGNGVLGVAALLLGVKRAVGVDVDPQACHEARINAIENGVAHGFSIIHGPVQAVGDDCFDLVLANLRPPTLATLMPALGALLADRGLLIFSGFRAEEQPGLERVLPREKHVVWQGNDRGWAAMMVA